MGSQQPPVSMKKTGSCGCHRPNYFARLVPEMNLFSKVCKGSLQLVSEYYYYYTIASNIICNRGQC